MSERQYLIYQLLTGATDEKNANWLADRITREVRAEALREVAEHIDSMFPDPNSLGSIFAAYVGDRIRDELRHMAAEADGGTDE